MARHMLSAIVLGTLAAAVAVRGGEAHLVGETTLRASPAGGEVLGLLTAEAPVTEIERQGEWVRVRVEGWVRVGSLAQAPTLPGPGPSAPPPIPPPSPSSAPAVAVAGAAPLEGTLEVKFGGGLFKKKLTGSGQQVWLLPAGFDLEAAGQVTPEDEARLGQLDAEAARLSKEAARAMQGSNFAESTKRHDALMAERKEILQERVGVLAAHHGRREAAARRAALFTAVCDARGFFVFPAIAPGSYRLYARLVDRELDLEWIEAVEVGAPGAKIELDETRAKGLSPGSGW